MMDAYTFLPWFLGSIVVNFLILIILLNYQSVRIEDIVRRIMDKIFAQGPHPRKKKGLLGLGEKK